METLRISLKVGRAYSHLFLYLEETMTVDERMKDDQTEAEWIQMCYVCTYILYEKSVFIMQAVNEFIIDTEIKQIL